MRNYVIAFYIRLSVEDFTTQSLSIPNQKLLLTEKAMSLPEWGDAEILEFVDNGHSGANFERPAVQELLGMVQAGKIDCILVKDLSRFGRNSIETGYFIERVFPLYRTRFISVSDDFDTANYKGDTGGIESAFQYLIHECYSRDLSVKIKSAQYAKMRCGEYQKRRCPYGYQKGADGRLEPNEEVAPIVRRIFGWAAQGNSASAIARKLYAQNIPTPEEYRASQGKPHHDISRIHGVWHHSTILQMLRDERYIGTYIAGKRAVLEVGSQRMRRTNPNEWLRIPEHHAPLVTKELFEQANRSLRHVSSSEKKAHDYPLRGKVFCGCCDHAMARKGTGSLLYCRHSLVSDSFACHGLKIRTSELERTVLETVRAQIYPVTEIRSGENRMELHTLQQVEQEEKMKSIQARKRKIYERYILGEIDLATYQEQKARYDTQMLEEKNVYAAITAQVKQEQRKHENRKEYESIMQEIKNTDRLTRLIDRLIRKVYVFPENRIEIEYVTQDFFGIKPEKTDNI